MRVKSRWFKPDAPKTAARIADAMAVIAFRVAQDALSRVRKAGCDVPAGAPYFAFLAEFLAFLVLAADRLAYLRSDDAWRVEFTTALANRLGAIVGDNEADLLGRAAVACKESFVARVNARADDYAACAFDARGPDYAFLRCAAHRIAEAACEEDRSFVVAQVIDIEAPEATRILQRAMTALLDASPRPRAAALAASEA